MFLHATWRTEDIVERRKWRFESENLEASGWLIAMSGTGHLGVRFEPVNRAKFLDPCSYAAPGALVELIDQLPEVQGSEASLCISAVPLVWMDAADAITGFLNRLGLTSCISGQQINIQGKPLPPSKLIIRAALSLFALDSNARGLVSPDKLARIQRKAITEFTGDTDDLIGFRDQQSGTQRLESLLRVRHQQPYNTLREEAVQSAFNRLGTKEVVQFDCGNGALLRRLLNSLNLKTAVGVEASLRRLQRAKARLGPFGIAIHGSVTEPGEELPRSATALLIGALPSATDARLTMAEKTLFGGNGFEWVLCVEGCRWSSTALEDWSASIEKRFNYDWRSWPIAAAPPFCFVAP